MGGEVPKNWRTARAGRPLTANRTDTYHRLIHAKGRLDRVRKRQGLRETAMADALDAIEGSGDQIELEDDVCLPTITRYLTELARAHRSRGGVP